MEGSEPTCVAAYKAEASEDLDIDFHVKIEPELEQIEEGDTDEWDSAASQRIKEETILPDLEDEDSERDIKPEFTSDGYYQLSHSQRIPSSKKPLAGVKKRIGNFICSICEGRKFKQRKAFQEHLNHHTVIREKEGKDRPIPRLKAIRNQRKLSKKQRVEKEANQLIQCEICPGREFTKKAFVCHMNHHKDVRKKEGKDRPLMTLQQSLEMVKERTKQNEIALTKGQDKEELRCEICVNRKFDSFKKFRNHMHLHKSIRKKEGKDRPIEELKTCKKEKRKKVNEEAEKEEEEKVLIETEVICNEEEEVELSSLIKCESTSTNREQTEGITADCDNDSVKYYCAICPGRWFALKKDLNVHMFHHKRIKKKEGQDRPVLTAAEMAEQGSSSSKFSHIPTKEAYSCNECRRKRFRNKGAYVAHLKGHETRKKLTSSYSFGAVEEQAIEESNMDCKIEAYE